MMIVVTKIGRTLFAAAESTDKAGIEAAVAKCLTGLLYEGAQGGGGTTATRRHHCSFINIYARPVQGAGHQQWRSSESVVLAAMNNVALDCDTYCACTV